MAVGLGTDGPGADGDAAPVAPIDVPPMGVVEMPRRAGRSRIPLVGSDAGDAPSAP